MAKGWGIRLDLESGYLRGSVPRGEMPSRKQNGPRHPQHGPPGGLFGIDQEVVTLRGLYGNSGFLTTT